MAIELGASSVQITKQVQGKVDAFYKQLYSLSNMLSYNPNVQYLLTRQDDKMDAKTLAAMNDVEVQMIAIDQYRQLFSANKNSSNDLKGIFLYTDQGVLLHNVLETRLSVNDQFKHQNWFQQVRESNTPILISEHSQDYASNQSVVTFARRLQSSKDFTDKGTLFIDISPHTFEEFLSDIQIGSTGFVFLMDSIGKPVYDSERFPVQSMLIESTIASKIGENPYGSFTQQYEGEKTLISYSSSEKTGWTVVAAVPWSEIGQELERTVRLNFIILLIIATTVMIIVSGLISSRLTQPMIKLKQAMKLAESGNFSARIHHHRNDEFGLLSDNFNKMLHELKRLQQEIIQTRMREFELQLYSKESELIALRAQINPHFLYNTLNTMSSIGEVYNVREVSLLSSALAEMFRYSSTGGHFSTLSEEIHHVNAYLTIMQIRYGNRYEVHIEIHDYMMNVRVIKMMLQPIVENAFQHGLEKRSKGRIDIIGAHGDKEIVITVLDDGEGISENRLAELNSALRHGQLSEPMLNEHIGLINVQKRLQLHYDGGAYLHISSEYDGGTAVNIHIPYDPNVSHDGGGDLVPSSDRR